MVARVLLTSAGNAPSNNIARSLRADSAPIFLVGCNHDQFVLKNSVADKNYVVPPDGHPQWLQFLRNILEAESIQLIIPTVDGDVMTISRARRALHRYVFLPSSSLLDTCQDKYRLIALLRSNGIDAPATLAVDDARNIASIFRQLPGRPLWCRARTGAGALGALPVQTAEQARSWIRYWERMRGVSASTFLLSEYLPGRDFGCQSIWKNGQLVLINTYERLSYLGAGSQPAEISSVAALAKTVVEPKVVDTCEKAIRLLDRKATGVFSADLKADVRGIPCITEINAGRFTSATHIFDFTGAHNMAATFVRLARGERVDISEAYDAAPNWYMLRNIDSLPRIFHASEFSDKIDGAWHASSFKSATSEEFGKGENRPWDTSRSRQRRGVAGRTSG